MYETIFQGVFDTGTTQVITPINYLSCVVVSLFIGIFLAGVYTYRSRYTQSFVLTLALIPAVVCMVIMLVNGNVGAGVAVAGTFSLVRFRSVPGTAKEIGAIFLAMSTGLATGMGYLGYGVLFAGLLGVVWILYTRLGLGELGQGSLEKTLHITIPENLDYTEVFEDTLKKYTKRYKLNGVRTTNMGSLFRISYDIRLKDKSSEKELIDALRCRNGNLEIRLNRPEMLSEGL